MIRLFALRIVIRLLVNIELEYRSISSLLVPFESDSKSISYFAVTSLVCFYCWVLLFSIFCAFMYVKYWTNHLLFHNICVFHNICIYLHLNMKRPQLITCWYHNSCRFWHRAPSVNSVKTKRLFLKICRMLLMKMHFKCFCIWCISCYILSSRKPCFSWVRAFSY